MYLDKTIDLHLSKDESNQFANELLRCNDLLLGMSVLYQQVRAAESKYIEVTKKNLPHEFGESENFKYFGAGNLPGLSEANVNPGLISCMFDWYSINACRLFDIIGYIAECLKKSGFEEANSGKKYRRCVCGPVLKYRNKIAAHYSFVDRDEEVDNPADIKLSALHNIGFENSRLVTGVWRLTVGEGGKSDTSQHDYSWSLTRFHENQVLPRLGKP